MQAVVPLVGWCNLLLSQWYENGFITLTMISKKYRLMIFLCYDKGLILSTWRKEW